MRVIRGVSDEIDFAKESICGLILLGWLVMRIFVLFVRARFACQLRPH